MANNFSTPPIGGENIPLRELKEEKPPVPEPIGPVKPETVLQAKKVKKLKLIMIGLVVFLLAVIIVLAALLLKPKPVPPPAPPPPTPTPTPVATSSAVGRNVAERIDALEKQVEALDLSETDLSFPILDFEINFEKDRR